MKQSHHNSTHANHGLSFMNLKKEAAKHTLRCLLGCNVGEATGAAIGYFLGLEMITTMIIAVGLAFTTGYAFTIIPMLKTLSLKQAARVAILGDTASISAMEFAENTVVFLIPGFIGASLLSAIFFAGIGIVFAVGFAASYPIMYHAMKKELQKDNKPSCH